MSADVTKSNIQRLYDSGINIKIVTQWGGGFDVAIGGDVRSGWRREGNVATWDEVTPWLESNAREAYPYSQFAAEGAPWHGGIETYTCSFNAQRRAAALARASRDKRFVVQPDGLGRWAVSEMTDWPTDKDACVFGYNPREPDQLIAAVPDVFRRLVGEEPSP